MNISDAARELLPCPFCGSTKIGEDLVFNTRGNVRYRYCGKCSAHGPWSKPDETRDKWNTRDTTATAALTLELETVKQKLQCAEDERADLVKLLCCHPNLLRHEIIWLQSQAANLPSIDAHRAVRMERDQLWQQLNSANEEAKAYTEALEANIGEKVAEDLGTAQFEIDQLRQQLAEAREALEAFRSDTRERWIADLERDKARLDLAEKHGASITFAMTPDMGGYNWQLYMSGHPRQKKDRTIRQALDRIQALNPPTDER